MISVYRNLRTGSWSLQERGRVFAHAEHVCLEHVRFVVQPAGRAKVRRTGQKNVHAFVRGARLVSSPGLSGLDGEPVRVTYNPYEYESFVNADTSEPVHAARRVSMWPDGAVFAWI